MPLLIGSLFGLIILVYHVSVVIKVVVTAKYHSAGQSNLKTGGQPAYVHLGLYIYDNK
jgi:hypothetical protein